MTGARKKKGEGKLGAHETHEARERGSGCSQRIVNSSFSFAIGSFVIMHNHCLIA